MPFLVADVTKLYQLIVSFQFPYNLLNYGLFCDTALSFGKAMLVLQCECPKTQGSSSANVCCDLCSVDSQSGTRSIDMKLKPHFQRIVQLKRK